MDLIFEIIGWSGSVIIVTAYALNSYQKLESNSAAFYLLNLVGGIMLIIYSNYKAAYANTFINIVWVLIALPALYKKFRGQQS